MNKDKILGFKNREIQIEHNKSPNTDKIYLIYPGSNYGFESPVFYYLRQLLIDENKDFYFINLKWDELGKQIDLPFEEALPYLIDEINNSFEYILNKKPKEIVIIAKSIGTLAIEESKKNKKINCLISKSIWLTPFKNTNELINYKLEKNKDFIYVGDNDPFFNQNIYNALEKTSSIRQFKNMDHNFNICTDCLENIESLIRIIKKLKEDIL